MVNTRGGVSQGDRLRPTTYVRRRHVNEDEKHEEHG